MLINKLEVTLDFGIGNNEKFVAIIWKPVYRFIHTGATWRVSLLLLAASLPYSNLAGESM